MKTGSANRVIADGKETSRTILAAIAGFAKFCPNPPNICLTTITAATLPIIPIQTGRVGGRFIPSRSPVTAAERSPTVTSFLKILHHMYSAPTAEATVQTSSNSARQPKRIQP